MVNTVEMVKLREADLAKEVVGMVTRDVRLYARPHVLGALGLARGVPVHRVHPQEFTYTPAAHADWGFVLTRGGVVVGAFLGTKTLDDHLADWGVACALADDMYVVPGEGRHRPRVKEDRTPIKDTLAARLLYRRMATAQRMAADAEARRAWLADVSALTARIACWLAANPPADTHAACVHYELAETAAALAKGTVYVQSAAEFGDAGDLSRAVCTLVHAAADARRRLLALAGWRGVWS